MPRRQLRNYASCYMFEQPPTPILSVGVLVRIRSGWKERAYCWLWVLHSQP